MKTLITGANGFIGRNVVRQLRRLDCSVVATSVEPAAVESFGENVRYVAADLHTKRDDWFEFFGKPDKVIHLAWAGLPRYGEMFHIEENLWASYHFLKQMIADGLRDVTVIGTCFEYGMQNGCLAETLPPQPNTAYAVAKNALRMFLEECRKQVNFNFKWVRLFYMYGEGQSKTAILSQLQAALDRGDAVFNMSGGEQLRDYLPVEKVAEGIVRIALQNEVQGIINCGSGQPISIRKLVDDFLHRTSQQIKLNLGHYPYAKTEPMAFWADVEKLQTIHNQQR